jgi:hypothetical protein
MLFMNDFRCGNKQMATHLATGLALMHVHGVNRLIIMKKSQGATISWRHAAKYFRIDDFAGLDSHIAGSLHSVIPRCNASTRRADSTFAADCPRV